MKTAPTCQCDTPMEMDDGRCMRCSKTLPERPPPPLPQPVGIGNRPMESVSDSDVDAYERRLDELLPDVARVERSGGFG